MPTYQYACTACGEQLEAVQSFSDPSLTECPSCRGQLRKVFSAVGVVFKGSGFYKNDSRNSTTGPDKADKAGKPVKDDKPAEKKSSETTAAKTDSTSTSSSTGSTSSSTGSTSSTPSKASPAA